VQTVFFDIIKDMIEVEKKFILTGDDATRLTEGAEFQNERVFTDIYYDTADFKLTTQDKWLRARDGQFELKMPLHHGPERMADQYDEIESEAEIRRALELPPRGSLAADLREAGYAPFCTCTTTRRKYKLGEFIIDLDAVDFRDFTYALGEIELMVDDKSEMQNATEKIIAFAKEKKLTFAPVRGKVMEYLKRMNQKHYQALIAAGVVKDF